MVTLRKILIGLFALTSVLTGLVIFSTIFFGKTNSITTLFGLLWALGMTIEIVAFPIAGIIYLVNRADTKRRLGLENSIVIAKQQIDQYQTNTADTKRRLGLENSIVIAKPQIDQYQTKPGFNLLLEYSKKNNSTNWFATYGEDTSNEYDEEKLQMLQKILLKQDFKISTYDLQVLLKNISRLQFAQDLRKRLRLGTKLTLDSICERFVLEYGENSTNPLLMDALIYVLVEEGLSKYENSQDIKTKLLSIKEDISLKHFENNLKSEKQALSLADIDRMNGHDFEDFIATSILAKDGFEILEVKKSGDQGGDILANKFGKKLVVQAKRYTGKVGNYAVQEVTAARDHYSCDDAWVITNSYFTKSAKELAKSTQVRLIDRDELKRMF